MTDTPTRAEAEARLTDEVLNAAWLADAESGETDLQPMRDVILTALYGPKAETPTQPGRDAAHRLMLFLEARRDKTFYVDGVHHTPYRAVLREFYDLWPELLGGRESWNRPLSDISETPTPAETD